MADLREVRERLLVEDANYRRLAAKHEELEKRLGELQTRRFPSEDEKLEEVTLKKQKLWVKDQMEEIIRHHLDPVRAVRS